MLQPVLSVFTLPPLDPHPNTHLLPRGDGRCGNQMISPTDVHVLPFTRALTLPQRTDGHNTRQEKRKEVIHAALSIPASDLRHVI